MFSLFLGFAANASQSLTQIYNIDPMSILKWKVGDSSDYNLNASFGSLGTMHKEVTKEEGNGVWLSEKVVAMGKEDETDVLFDRDSAKVLKLIHNGKEESVPDEKPVLVSQDYTEVTVPAGTFKALHIVAKTKSVSHIEIWDNTRDVVIDGTVKQVMTTQFGDITLELTQQHKTQ